MTGITSGTIRFGLFGSARLFLGADLVRDVVARHPGVRVELIGQNSTEVQDHLVRGYVEAALIAIPVAAERMTVRPVARDELVYLSADQDRLERPVTGAQLAKADLVLPETTYRDDDSSRRLLRELVQRTGNTLRTKIEVEDVETAIEIVGYGHRGLGRPAGCRKELLPRLAPHVGWVSLRPRTYDVFALVHRRDAVLSPAALSVIELATRRIRPSPSRCTDGHAHGRRPRRRRTSRSGPAAPADRRGDHVARGRARRQSCPGDGCGASGRAAGRRGTGPDHRARLPRAVVLLRRLMYVVATATSTRRLRLPRDSTLRGARHRGGGEPGRAAHPRLGVIPLEGVGVIPIAGIVIGNAMTAATLAGRRAFDELDAQHGATRQASPLGLQQHEAAQLVIQPTAMEALVPGLDQTRTVGLVTLPGAFVGVLLGGGTPLEAGAAQVLVLVGLLAAQAVTAATVLRLVARGQVTRTQLSHAKAVRS